MQLINIHIYRYYPRRFTHAKILIDFRGSIHVHTAYKTGICLGMTAYERDIKREIKFRMLCV